MKDKSQSQSTHESRQQDQGIPEPKRTGGQQQGGFPHEDGDRRQSAQHEQGGATGDQLGSGQRGEKRGGAYAEQMEREGEAARKALDEEDQRRDTDEDDGL